VAEAQARALGAARPWVLRREASAEKWKCCREEPLEARVPRVANWTRWHDLRMRFSQQCVEEREGRGYMHMFPCLRFCLTCVLPYILSPRLSRDARDVARARPRHASTRRATWPDKTIPRCVHGWT
jgi:hypothetical protein